MVERVVYGGECGVVWCGVLGLNGFVRTDC